MIVQRLTEGLIQIASLGWPILVALGLQMVALRLMNITGKRLQNASGGHEAFDLQNKLTAAQIYEQLPAYTAE